MKYLGKTEPANGKTGVVLPSNLTYSEGETKR